MEEIRISIGQQTAVEEELGDGNTSVTSEDNPYVTAKGTSYIASHDLADGGTASISETSGDDGDDNLEESRKKLTKHSLRSLIEKEIKKFGKKHMFEAWQGRPTDTAYAFHDKHAGEAKELLKPLLEMGDNLAVIEKFIDLVSERVAFKNTTGSELHYTDIERVMDSPVINALLVDDEGAEEFKNTFVGEAATLLGVDISSESEI